MSDKKAPAKILYCSFCGKSQHEVRKLIAGPSVFICDECIELVQRHHREEEDAKLAGARRQAAAAAEIRKILDRLRDRARTVPKKVLSVAVYNHYKRLEQHGRPRLTTSSSPRATSC